MQDLIRIDGRYYNAAVTSLKRSHVITDGKNAGRSEAPQVTMIRDVIGTFCNYKATFEQKENDKDEYDALIEALVQPVDSVQLKIVYGQQTITFDAYITKVEDELQAARRWGKLSVEFTAVEPLLRP